MCWSCRTWRSTCWVSTTATWALSKSVGKEEAGGWGTGEEEGRGCACQNPSRDVLFSKPACAAGGGKVCLASQACQARRCFLADFLTPDCYAPSAVHLQVDLNVTKRIMDSEWGQQVCGAGVPWVKASWKLSTAKTLRANHAVCCLDMHLHLCNTTHQPPQVKERGIIMVGESGIFTPEDVAFVQQVGGVAVPALWASAGLDGGRKLGHVQSARTSPMV